MKYYYEDNSLIYKFEGKLHDRIIMYNTNYNRHIKARHKDISKKIIELVLKEPDFIYKSSVKSKVYYYEKKFGNDTFRVVINKYKKHVKSVVTAYKVKAENLFNKKHIYCVYDKENFYDIEGVYKELEEDYDYFCEMFNAAE